METQVTQRVESAIRGVNGVEEISSTVVEGNSTTFVQFQLGTPTDRAVNDVRNAISQIRGNLPEGILEPQVTRVDAEDEPISYIGAQTTDMTLEQLSWYIDNTVAKRLLGLPGIAAVQRVGGVDRTIRVILDPAALEAQGITAAQVNQQLRQSNMNGAGGRAEIAGSEQSVRVHRQRATTPISSRRPRSRCPAAASSGSPISRKVEDSNSEQRSLAKMNGRQVVTFMIQRAKGSSEVTAYDSMQKELKALEKENPKVHFSEVFNTVDYTKAQYTLRDGGPDRRRDPRRSRRAPVPARHSRDRDFGARHPAFGDPRLLLHEPDGHHHELHVDDGHGPGRRRPRRRRDRRDREHRPAHAHGQIGLSGRRSTPPTRSVSPSLRRPWRSSPSSSRSR